MKTKNIIFTLFTLLISIIGCKEEELDLQDPNVIVPDVFFQNSGELQSAVNAAYSFLQTQGMYGRIGFFLYDNLSQENLGTDALQGGLKAFMDYTYDPSLGELLTFWEACYRGVASANFVIESIESDLVQNVSQDEIDQRLGEAKFLRALYYFNLTNVWGGVPLLTAPATDANGTPKATQAEVYALILDDLNFAKANLPAKGDTQDGRATKGAAQALKGKAHLFLEQWEEAKAELEAIAGYTIVGVDPRDNGNIAGEFNPESIFEVNYDEAIGGDQWGATGSGVRETTFRGIEYSPLNFANIVVRPSLLDKYEDGDPRIKAYFYSAGDEFGGQRYPEGSDLPINGPVAFGPSDGSGTVPLVFTFSDPRWRKYQNLDTRLSDGFEYSGINFRVLRYADVLLMWAEAENELGNTEPAITLLNRVRDRVGMPNYGTAEMDSRGYPVGSQAQVFDAIVHERTVELAGEQIRYMDLKRWGMLAEEIIGFQTGKHEWMPIPQAEIDGNPLMTNADQNPGY
ncbi:RagB/SusD family nutrient uptake outer membrane protein [Arenibacter sp. F26102]|uniref:RagB/SusD family nutrient uptake outer membrane protein n=1 Tax=Arenibacter sp. F26102 TaxID=2926416 RepID=UPI001FF5D32B|nr:RagB/SusD family nutrient uptake outer membrane protein [Arenibacter sp. F26102]MCK0148249.1 RagB/SusD family nutrient uptake outer membrane protein [Arenibacter sp. F26102]